MLRGQIEKKLLKQGLKLLGIDEVGRGCLAGPVYAACVSLNYELLHDLPPKTLALVRDSKKLSTKQRQSILPVLETVASHKSIGIAEVWEIESLGIAAATFLAMLRAFEGVGEGFDHILIDGNQQNAQLKLPQTPIIGGDDLCFAIAAASIIAKEARDSFMREAELSYPGYGFINHVGYGTKSHLQALQEKGITPLHRKNFAPIRVMFENQKTAAFI